MRRIAVLWATVLAVGTAAPIADAANCTEITNRATVIRCALEASLLVQAEEHGIRSVEGRRQSAGVFLPSNPTLAVTGGYPIEPALDRRPLLWSATLSQELEIAGQRSARLRANSAEISIQRARLMAVRREAAAAGLLDYFNVLAATKEVQLAQELSTLADGLRAVAVERSASGIGSELDATLADATTVRVAELKNAAQERLKISMTALASRLGLEASEGVIVEGNLVPLPLATAASRDLVDAAVARRTDLAMANAEREFNESRVALYKRLRIPNPTVSIMARSDWIGERSVGVGLGFPIPLPAPLGRSYSGEIAESAALAERASAEIEALRRTIAREVKVAMQRVLAARKRVELYTPERLQKVRQALRSIAEELRAGRLPPRDALLTQQNLVDVLSSHLEAQRALCLASVELALTTGLVLEEGMR